MISLSFNLKDSGTELLVSTPSDLILSYRVHYSPHEENLEGASKRNLFEAARGGAFSIL